MVRVILSNGRYDYIKRDRVAELIRKGIVVSVA